MQDSVKICIGIKNNIPEIFETLLGKITKTAILLIPNLGGLYMFRSTMGFIKGLGFGVIACIAAASVASYQMRKNRHFRRNANRTMRSVDHLIGDVSHMFR